MLFGDLNMTPAAVARWSGMRALASAPTFPADLPSRQLDHIVTDDAGLAARAHATPRLPISDHRPLVVEIDRVER
jgi:endonuclease/exonuclease/phosphatase family metal-dependent hydrolase